MHCPGHGGDHPRLGGADGDKSERSAGKLNCIILGEIDGVDTKVSITALVGIIHANIPQPVGSSLLMAKRGRGVMMPYLCHPIILICNHKYAPALSPIPPYVHQFHSQPPNPERLSNRLHSGLAAKRMPAVAGGILLHKFVACMGSDARRCLYALQFMSTQAWELAIRKHERKGVEVLKGNNDVLIVDCGYLVNADGHFGG